MGEQTQEELEFEIIALTDNIEVLKALGEDASDAQKRLAMYRSKLLKLIADNASHAVSVTKIAGGGGFEQQRGENFLSRILKLLGYVCYRTEQQPLSSHTITAICFS